MLKYFVKIGEHVVPLVHIPGIFIKLNSVQIRSKRSTITTEIFKKIKHDARPPKEHAFATLLRMILFVLTTYNIVPVCAPLFLY